MIENDQQRITYVVINVLRGCVQLLEMEIMIKFAYTRYFPVKVEICKANVFMTVLYSTYIKTIGVILRLILVYIMCEGSMTNFLAR